MAAIYLNPEKLQNCVKALRDLAQDCLNAKSSISNSSQQLGDPYSKISDFETSASSAASTVSVRADAIENIKKKIVRLNECGIATKNDGTGTITCDVPPEVDIENGSGEFVMWAQGAIDAHDLQKYADDDGKSVDRTYEDIVSSMEANASNGPYSAGFIDKIGAENLVPLPTDLESAFTINDPDSGDINTHPGAGERVASILGTMLASASHTWTPEKGQSVAKGMRSSMDEKGEYYRIATFNAMLSLSGHDSNNDGVNDLDFSDTFLASLGNEVEKINWSEVKQYEILLRMGEGREDYEDRGGQSHAIKQLGGTPLEGYSLDPLVGVIDVMGSPANVNAAADFLAPKKGDESDVSRIQDLMRRHSLGDNDWTDQWTEVLQSTAKQFGTEVVPDGGKASDRSKQAAIINAAGINTIGAEADEVSDDARSRLANVLQVYPWSVDEAAMRDDPNPKFSIDSNPGDEDYTLRGLPPQPQFGSKSLANVVGLISENKDDFAKVNEAVGSLNNTRTAYAIAQAREGNRGLLTSAMEHTSASRGFLISSAQANVEADAKDKDARNKMIIDSVMAATSFIPGPGEGFSELAKNSYSYALDRGKSLATVELEDQFTGNLTAAMEEHAAEKGVQNEVVQAELLLMMMHGNIFSPDEKAELQSRSPSLFDDQSEDGKDALFDAEGNVRPENLTAENIEELTDIIRNPNNALDESMQNAFRASSDSYSDGYDHAR